jgi:hypothetical protein
LAKSILEQLGPTYRKNKRELSVAERALYESALTVSVRALNTPAEAKQIIGKHRTELAEQRKRAEELNLKRKTITTPTTTETGGEQTQ